MSCVSRALTWAVVLVGTTCAAQQAKPSQQANWPPVLFDGALVGKMARMDAASWSADLVPREDATRREQVTRLVRGELAAKYSQPFLRELLEAVHVVEELRCDGRRWGGTHCNREIIITCGLDEHMIAALHHEIAGVLLAQSATPFPWREWRLAGERPEHSEREVTYLPAVSEATASPGSKPTEWKRVELSDVLAKEGWLSEYGRTTSTNDVEEYFRLVMTQPGRVLQVARGHERVAAKLRILLGFVDDASGGQMNGRFHRAWMKGSGDSILAADPALLEALGK